MHTRETVAPVTLAAIRGVLKEELSSVKDELARVKQTTEQIRAKVDNLEITAKR